MMLRNVVRAARPALRLNLVAQQRAAVLRVAPVCLQRPYRQFSDEVAAAPSRKPTIADVIDSPREYYEMPPDVLLTLAVAEDPGARTERLIREIMIVDNVSWDDAEKKMQEIAAANAEVNSFHNNLSKTYFKTMAFVRSTCVVTLASTNAPPSRSAPAPRPYSCCHHHTFPRSDRRFRLQWGWRPFRSASTSTPRSGSTISL